MTNKTISLSDEAEISLEERRKKDPTFNLSSFVSEKLLQIKENAEDPNSFILEIEKNNSMINELRIQNSILEEKKFKLEVKKKAEQEEIEREVLKKEKREADTLRLKEALLKEINGNTINKQ